MNSVPENSALLLREMPLYIRYKDHSQSFECKVFFDLSLTNPLFIEPQHSLHELCRSPTVDESLYVTIPNVSEPVECYVLSATYRIGGDRTGHFVRLSPRFSNITLHTSSALVRVNAGVLNFAGYRFRGSEPFAFQLAYSDWVFDFTPVMEGVLLYPPQLQNEEYLFTHHVCLTKKAGKCFSSHDAVDQLTLLADFLSFCRGYWVSTALTSGMVEDGTIAMEEWGTGKVSPAKSPHNWLDLHHGECMVKLFQGFVARISDATWKDAIEHAMYWYIRADTNLVGPDGACILLQAALERLAWHVLVRDRKSLSEGRFRKLPAADHIRLLLSALSIPPEIPAGLIDLQAVAKGLEWLDGPQAFVEVRNRLVHPPKAKRKKRKLPYYEVYSLGKWYVELILLRACNYTGQYSNRTLKKRFVGQVEDVPWTDLSGVEDGGG